jgi:hypothetical protein
MPHKNIFVYIILSIILVISCQKRDYSVLSPFTQENQSHKLSEIHEQREFEQGKISRLSDYIPTPFPGYGVVIGKIVTKDPTRKIGLSIFLGDIIIINENRHGAFLDKKRAPIGVFDHTTGRFIFEKVRPGIYALIISEPESGGWVYMTDEGDVVVIKVLENKIIDLGELTFDR